MWQYVIRDYFRAYRWNNVKHAWKTTSQTSASILAVLIVFMVEVILWVDDFSVTERIIIYGGYDVPFVFSWYANVIHPMVLSKMFYLCPMNKDERKKYIVNSYIFKIAFSMAVSVPGLILVVIYFGFDPLMLITAVISNLIINIMIPTELYMKENVEADIGNLFYFDYIYAYEEWKDKECAIKIALVLAITTFANLNFMGLTDMEVVDGGSVDFVRIIIFLIMLSIEIPLVKGYKNFIKLHIKVAEEFEAVDVKK